MTKSVGMCVLAAAALGSFGVPARAVEVRVPFDPALSTLTVRVCRGAWVCDLDGGAIRGYWRVDVDSTAAPTSLTLKGFVIDVPSTIVSSSVSSVPGAGTFSLIASAQRLTFGGFPGTTWGPSSIIAGQFRLNDTPVNISGTFDWSATGTGCMALPMPTTPRCSGSGNPSAFNSRVGNLFGPVSSAGAGGNLLAMTGSISILTPADFLDPGAATVTYIINARGTGSRCAADFNADGNASIDDIFFFINAWLAGDPNADATFDTYVSIDDLFVFVNRWLTGCT